MTEEEIITAVVFTPRPAEDGKQLPTLLNISQATDVEVKEVLADTANSRSDKLKLLQQQDITATIPLNPAVHGARNMNDDGYNFVKDADAVQCPAGLSAFAEARKGKKGTGKNQRETYYFDIEKCKTRPLREGCYSPGSRTKTYSIRILSDHHAKQIKY